MAQATYATSGIGSLIAGASVEQFASPFRAAHVKIAQTGANHDRLFSALVFHGRSKPHPGATAVLVDELDAPFLPGATLPCTFR